MFRLEMFERIDANLSFYWAKTLDSVSIEVSIRILDHLQRRRSRCHVAMAFEEKQKDGRDGKENLQRSIYASENGFDEDIGIVAVAFDPMKIL